MTQIATAATVVTLVAEVRVLMVGSRQVTLSVFRQLDTSKYSDVVPMGRVNDGGGNWIVGRHKNTGELTRARFDREHPGMTFEEKGRLGRLRACLASQPPHNVLSQDSLANLKDLENTEAHEAEWVSEYRQSVKTHTELPLIVLAGLK